MIFLTSERKFFSGNTRPIFARTGSIIRPATSLFFVKVFSNSLISLYGTTSVFFETSSNPPSDIDIPLCAEPEPAFTRTVSYAP